MTNSRRILRLASTVTVLLFAAGAIALHAQSTSRPGDGIIVHGHWTIDIKNADGGLAAHHEFENALEPSGASALAQLLGRQSQPMTWRLELIGTNAGGACVRLAPTGTVTVAPLDPAPGPVQGSPYFVSEFVVSGTSSMWIGVVDPLSSQNNGQLFFDVAEADAANPPPGFRLIPLTAPAPSGGLRFATFTWDRTAPPGQYAFHLGVHGPFAGGVSVYLVSMTIAPPTAPDQSSGSYPCSAVEAVTLIPGDLDQAWFPTLELAIVEAGGGRQHLELTGNVHVTGGEAIEQVRSVIVLSSGAVLPFSSRALATHIQVAAGQTVYVKVVFSFA
jgi:hypothetical protein